MHAIATFLTRFQSSGSYTWSWNTLEHFAIQPLTTDSVIDRSSPFNSEAFTPWHQPSNLRSTLDHSGFLSTGSQELLVCWFYPYDAQILPSASQPSQVSEEAADRSFSRTSYGSVDLNSTALTHTEVRSTVGLCLGLDMRNSWNFLTIVVSQDACMRSKWFNLIGTVNLPRTTGAHCAMTLRKMH